MPIKNCDSCQNAEGVIRDDQNSLVCKACFNRDEDIYLSPVCNEQIERYRCDACGLLNIQIRKWGCQELGPFCICAGSNGERARMRGGYQITGAGRFAQRCTGERRSCGSVLRPVQGLTLFELFTQRAVA